MRRLDRSSRILLAGALISAALHGAAAAGFVRWSAAALTRLAHRAEPTRPPQRRPEAIPEPRIVRLGLEKSNAATMAWLGFEKPTEHQAEPGKVDQSAMTL